MQAWYEEASPEVKEQVEEYRQRDKPSPDDAGDNDVQSRNLQE